MVDTFPHYECLIDSYHLARLATAKNDKNNHKNSIVFHEDNFFITPQKRFPKFGCMIKIFIIENTRVCVKPITKWEVKESILWTSRLYVTPEGSRCFYQVLQKAQRLFVYKEIYINTYFASVQTRKELIEEAGLVPSSYLELNHLVSKGYSPVLHQSEYNQSAPFEFYTQESNNEYNQVIPQASPYAQPIFTDEYNTVPPDDCKWYWD